jgi:hypothetical protein
MLSVLEINNNNLTSFVLVGQQRFSDSKICRYSFCSGVLEQQKILFSF